MHTCAVLNPKKQFYTTFIHSGIQYLLISRALLLNPVYFILFLTRIECVHFKSSFTLEFDLLVFASPWRRGILPYTPVFFSGTWSQRWHSGFGPLPWLLIRSPKRRLTVCQSLPLLPSLGTDRDWSCRMYPPSSKSGSGLSWLQPDIPD